MSMPKLPSPNPDFTQEQALTMILSSIALEEVALSHIMNAEGEKIQHIISQTNGHDGCTAQDILAVNKSVTSLLEIVLQNQMILKNKMEKVLEYLPKPPCPPEPPPSPCPPIRPCPPDPHYCEHEKCCALKQSCCFDLIPNFYHCDEALQWTENNVWGRFGLWPGDCSKIRMPRTGTFAIDLYLETGNFIYSSSEIKLIVCCEEKSWITKVLPLERLMKSCCFHKRALIEMPCSCFPCYIFALVSTPCGSHIRQGKIVFTKL